MKAIIKNKIYDTDNATRIGGYQDGEVGDLNSIAAGLYKTENGSFFLAIHGGANTQYATRDGNTRYGGSEITPISRADAFAWAQEHFDNPDKAIEEFGDLVEEA